jgi:pimeloyl-ACP methyl ester carboxylesterase
VEKIINGFKTNYQIFGDKIARDSREAGSPYLGKPFLILHGWGSNLERWIPVAQEISKKGFKVIVPDLPGFGKSDALAVPWNTNNYINWMEQFVKELNLGDFYLLGHSFGGALASKIAVKHAQDVKKLFLVSAACVRKRTAKKSWFKRISKIIKIFHFLPYYSFFRKAIYKFVIRKSDYVYVEGIMKETYLNVVSEDLSFHLPFIKVPTVIIWGEKDEFTPIEDAHLINKQIKNSKLVIIPGAGHDLNRKQPEILAGDVLNNI